MKTETLRNYVANEPVTGNMFYGLRSEEQKNELISVVDEYSKLLDYVPNDFESFADAMDEKYGEPVDKDRLRHETNLYNTVFGLVSRYTD